MKNEKVEINNEKNWDLDKLFSFLSILNIVSNTDDFRQWLRKFHSLKSDTHLFTGYQFFIDVVISHIVDAIDSNFSFALESDYTLYRASFRGVNIDDVPTSCEKTKLIKNLWFFYRDLRLCQNYKELSQNLERKNKIVLSTFNSIFEEYITPKGKTPKEKVVFNEMLLNTHVYLNDTSKGIPLAYPNPLIDSFINEKNFDKVFSGYLYTLQYLWFKLLDEQEFLDSSVSEMHKAIDFFERDEEDDAFSFDFDPLEKQVYYNWMALDRFFSKINQEIFDKKSLRIRIGLQLNNEFPISSLDPLMNLVSIQEPKFLTFGSNLSDNVKN